ncbi:GAF domain-containing protein [Streptomyces sp. LMG1-1-1.1]|uniref:GAF domain-containing sensor histidine kinase n=1 Tax=Streptomyces sp. LMG1-1-1.1 TaxID=3135245 RepID=UPI003466CC98
MTIMDEDAEAADTDDGTDTPRLPLLLEAVLSVGTDLELRTTLQHIVDSATELTGARYGALGVVDPERHRLTELFTSGMTDEDRQRIALIPDDPTGPPDNRTGLTDDRTGPPDNRTGLTDDRTGLPDDPTGPPDDRTGLPDDPTGLLGALVRDPRSSLRIDDLTADPRTAGVPEGHPETRAFLGVPIRVHTEVFGNLYLTEKRPGGFTEEDLALLRVLASQAGIAIGNARLYETARQRERWIEGAAAVTTALLTGASAENALTTVAERARLLAGASAGVVLQPTAEGGMEIVAASATDDPGDLVGTTIAPGSPVLVQLLGGEAVFVEDSATDPRMTTAVRTRFGPSMMLPLQSGGKLIGTLALPRRRGDPPYSAVDRLLASQFASQAALALVLADARHDRERLAVYEDRDRIARDLHDLVVQRLFATEMMLESTRRRAAGSSDENELLGRAVDELDSTIQEVRTTIFALQQPPADAPASFRGRVLRETGGAAALLGFQPSVHFSGAVDTLTEDDQAARLLATLRGALAAAHRRPHVTALTVDVSAGPDGVHLRVEDDGTPPVTVTWP